MTFLLALVLSQPLHICDNPRPAYPVLVAEHFTLWFCGKPIALPTNERVPVTIEIDGVPQGANWLLRYPGDVAPSGLTEYVAAEAIRMPSPGPHVVRVTYGAERFVVTLTRFSGAVCAGPTVPAGVLTLECPQ